MFSAGICRWLFLLISLTAWMTLANSKELRVVCYYTNWSVYRPGTAKFSPQNINPYLCTHLIYAFGGFTKENTLKPFDKYQDIEKGGYAKFTGLKTYNKNLKTMLAIGGWNEGSSRFSPMVASAERRKELVKNAVKFLRLNHFDGLDLDWEYPNFRDGGKPRDKENYAQLVKELREEFERESEKTGRPRLLLTMAVPAGIEYVNKGYDVPKLMKYLDWMNMLSYDFHSAFEPAVNHHAPLFSLEEENEYNYDTELNIDYTIKHYMKMGADPAKLVLGIPTYGRSYTLFNPDANEIGAPADGPGEMGEATRENGYLAYYEICEYVKDNDWEVVQPNSNAMGPYAYKDNQWVGYDDEDIVRKKAEYVAKNGLGGIMFWAIDNDDFRGSCHGKPYPLIEAGKEALLDAYGNTENNLVAPSSKTIKSKPKTRTRASAKSTSSVEKLDVISTTSSSTGRRRRIKSKSRSEERSTEKPKRRNESRKTTESSTHSSLKIVTPSYTTPAPPSTPDVGGVFKCEDEGFFPHPKDCKKYYWCLSGAGDTGIIAHQFTCPAGLYFNKAADSCDYTQNVLCNKKLQKVAAAPATSTKETPEPTETTSKATPSSFFSSTRAPPKITAATSRTTFKQTTTTENAEEEYEYYDDDDVEEDTKSEEDPKVIKELVDLIRKAGGIEELEKYLNVDKDSTTPSTISKSLYEKVLSKTSKSTLSALKKTSANRNSKGPQNYGLTESDESSSVQKKFERSRPQYKTISRPRSSNEKPNQGVNNDDDENGDTIEETKNSSNKKSSLEYTNIRRGTTSTTSKPETNSGFSRNKLLGEEYVDEEEADEEENVAEKEKNRNTPQYVNIRRQRPSTTESSTSRYVELRRRPTTQSSSDTAVEDENNSKFVRRSSTTEPSNTEGGRTTLKYKTIRRGTTEPTTTEEASLKYENTVRQTTNVKTNSEGTSTSRYQIIRRGSPLPSIDEENDVTAKYQTLQRKTSTVSVTEIYPDQTTPLSTVSGGNIISSDLEDTVSNTTPTESQQSVFTTTIAEYTSKHAEEATTEDKILTVLSSTVSDVIKEKKKPFLLLQPRPFSKTTRLTPSPTKISETTTETVKVSETNFKSGLRPNSAESQTSQYVDNSSIRSRNRGLSRFNSNSRIKSKTPSEKESDDSDIPKQQRLRKRLLITTDRSVNFNEDQTRSYRPSELADLSSLTAVDFDNIKGLNLRPNSQRRRRPIPTTTTSTTTEKAPEKNVPNTNTLTRKVINRTLFGKTAKANVKTDPDQLNESSNLSSTTKRLRGFRFSTERSTTPIKDEKLSTTTFNVNEDAPLRTVTSPRTRKIIRRFRPRTSTVKIESSTESRISSTKTTFDNLIDQKPSRFPFNLSQNNKEADEGVEEANEEGENIKLSESNIRENSDVNSFDDSKQRKKFVKLVRPKFESLHQKTNVEEKEDSLEDNNASNVNQNYETVSSTTPLPLPLKRRKIIRKFGTTEPTSVDIPNDSENGRKRKVIRRLRPSTPYNTLDTKGKETNKYGIKINKLFLKGRSTSTTEATTKEQTVEEKVVPKILFRPSESQRTRNGQVTSDNEDNTNTTEKAIIGHSANNTTTEENSEHLTTPSYNSDYVSYSNYDEHPEMFSSTIHYEPYSSSPYFDESEDDDHTFYSFDDHDFTTNYSGEDDESDDEPAYSVMGFSSTNRSHHFESNTNFANEDEDDEAQKTLSASVINTSKNIRNESTLFTPKLNQEENKENDDPTDKSQNDDTDKDQPQSEPTTRKNPLLRSQKERPSFIRPRITTSTTPSISNVSRPKYKNFSRSTTTTTTTTAATTATTLKPEAEHTEKMHDYTTLIATTISPETETETHSSKYIDNEILTTTDAVDEDNDVESNATTESERITINNEIDEVTDAPIAKTTLENFEDNSLDTTIDFSDRTTEGDLLLTLSTEEIFTEDNTEENHTEVTSTETSLSETSSEYDVSSTTTSTTEYHPRSTLRSIQNRPKFGIPRKSEFSTTSTVRPSTRNMRNKFSNKRLRKTTTEATDLYKVVTPKVIPVDKLLYKYSTTERLQEESNLSKDTEEDNDDEEEEGIEETEGNNKNNVPIKDSEYPLFRPKSTTKRIQNTPFSTRKTNRPQFGKSKQRTLNKPRTFLRTTETPKISEDLSELTKKLVKNRNNNLFSQRKIISPTAAPSTTTLDSSTIISTDIDKLNEVTSDIFESVTKPSTKEMETTEYLTTLHHIFAEVNETTNDAETTTESLSSVTASSGKVERVIEVNRIVEVYTKEAKVKNHTGVVEEQTKVQVIPTLDKIGEVNRVTVIKVVDENGKNSTILEKHKTEGNEVKPDKNNNKTSIEEVNDIPSTSQEIARVEEVPHPGLITLNVTNIKFNFNLNNEESNREDRKFEIYGGSKVADNSLSFHGKSEIIDGKSQIDVVTPRPVYYTEASTIALQGLFTTEPPKNHLNPSFTSNDELLETEHSKFVNVRILDQDEHVKIDRGIRGDTKKIPVRLLPQDEDEDYTLKARVVEITPKPSFGTIKIVPIKVEMARKVRSVSESTQRSFSGKSER